MYICRYFIYSVRMYDQIDGEIDSASGCSYSLMTHTDCMQEYGCLGTQLSLFQTLYKLNGFDEM